jgi:hypothetical protein
MAMNLLQSASYRLLIALAGSALASFIIFAASPLALQMLDEAQYAHLAVWAIFLIFVQVLDIGYSQLTIKMCSNEASFDKKIEIIINNNNVIYLLIIFAIIFTIVVPKPSGDVYESINSMQWLVFKISIILNLKISYNQSSMIVLNKQFEYTVNQIYLSISRFIAPIIVYYLTNSIYFVLSYYIFSTIIFIIYTDRIIGINLLNSIKFKEAFFSIKNNFPLSISLYLSSAIAIILSVMDRLIASKILEMNNFVLYSATFSLASAVNIIVLPFYRVFVGRISSFNRIFNQKNALRISLVQSYVCLFIVSFIFLYSTYIISFLNIKYPIDIYLLLIISISFWGAANGWIIATEIILSESAGFQAYLIFSAMVLYCIYLFFQKSISIYDVSTIWIFHGFIQTFICPIWISKYNIAKKYLIWVRYVVIIPFIVVAFVSSILYIISIYSKMYSIIAFFMSFCLFGLLISRSSSIRKAF